MKEASDDYSSNASFIFSINPRFFLCAGLSSSVFIYWFSVFPESSSNFFNASFASGLSFSGVWITSVT